MYICMAFNFEKLETFNKILDIVLTNPGMTINELYDEIQITFGLSDKMTSNYVNLLLRRKLTPRLKLDPETRVVSVCQ